ncbi:magnesium citrate secondary transporter [Pontibacter sp. BT213]|uniref:Magnesium citrate secondary transporter n=1 Tax=Pontibacter fetidus TaxID=2700082 RepID=A0A6B2H3F5_9BACT|nr:magnesium citrate secondary transporter [Pontibacter fetidus]
MACLLLFWLNQLLEWQHIFISPLYQYLDDLLCMPLVLTITLATERLYFSNNYFVLPLRYSLVAAVLVSIYFEVILPLFSPVYTPDAVDVLCYSVGVVVFQVLINRPL